MENRQQLNEKTHTALILILLIIIPVSGFSFWKEAPEDVLIKFLKTFYSNSLNKTYNYVSKADQDAISREEFIKQNNLDDPFRLEMAEITSSLNKYEINETKIDEDRAVVDIKITKPNMSKVYAEIFGPFHGPKDMKDPQEAARHMLRQYLKKGDVPMAEEKMDFTLVKEEGKWKFLLNPENNKR